MNNGRVFFNIIENLVRKSVMVEMGKEGRDTYCLYNTDCDQFASFSLTAMFAGAKQPSYSILWFGAYRHRDVNSYTAEAINEGVIPYFRSKLHDRMNPDNMTIVLLVDGEPDFSYSVSFENWKEQWK